MSFGVLHHTGDCLGALGKMCSLIKPGGTIAVGLYHKYGRAPFIEYFQKMKKNGLSEQELFEEYKKLDSNRTTETHLMSWFRDQVLHPYESQHSLAEVCHVFDEHGVRLNSTSINSYASFSNVKQLFEDEKQLYQRGVDMLKQGKYYPGFFVAEGRKLSLT